jgi:hypothetical protein
MLDAWWPKRFKNTGAKLEPVFKRQLASHSLVWAYPLEIEMKNPNDFDEWVRRVKTQGLTEEEKEQVKSLSNAIVDELLIRRYFAIQHDERSPYFMRVLKPLMSSKLLTSQ